MDSPALRLVFWETTPACNLACVHCRRLDTALEDARNDLSTAEATTLIDQIASCRTAKGPPGPILIFSGGEPLMRSDLFDLARHAVSRHLPIALASNGTLINDTIAGDLRDAGFRRVAISLDGPDAATHDAFRGIDGSFAGALDGIAAVRAAGISVQINTTVTVHNHEKLDDLYQLALNAGADALHIFMLVPVGCGVQIADEQMLSPQRYEQVLNWLYDRDREGRIQIKATCAPHYYRIMHQRAAKEGVSLHDRPTHGMSAVTKGCLAGTAVCFVSHSGQVFPCGYLPVEAGNVRERPFNDIWQDATVFQRLRNENALTGACGACDYRGVCGGCRARAYYEYADYLAQEPYCVFARKDAPTARPETS